MLKIAVPNGTKPLPGIFFSTAVTYIFRYLWPPNVGARISWIKQNSQYTNVLYIYFRPLKSEGKFDKIHNTKQDSQSWLDCNRITKRVIMSRIVFFDELDTNDSLSENIKEQQLNLITRHNEFVYWNISGTEITRLIFTSM